MSDQPERVWIYNMADKYENPVQDWEPSSNPADYTHYTRTDLIPDPMDDPRVKALVEARKRHIEATNAYNAKLEEVRKAREGRDWSIAPHDGFREMGERHREFIAAAQDFADAALAAMKGGG